MSQQCFSVKQDYVRQLRYARSKFRRINSLDLIPENPSQEEFTSSSSENDEPNNKVTNSIKTHTKSLSKSTNHQTTQLLPKRTSTAANGILHKILLFWPNFVVNLILVLLRFILYIPLSIAAPSFWLSAILWIFWKLMRLPVSFIKWLLNFDATYEAAISSSRPSASLHKRTILLSSGSTIQTLHLARNFHSSGARVVVFEFEGLFGLARFSTAVDKFYVVPRPTSNNVQHYIAALCHIVSKEKPTVYIPVCATSPAYYDALAKPHLELLNCACFIPGLQETAVLDDCLQFYQKCIKQNIALPPYTVLSSPHELWDLYESGFISNFRNILIAVGMQGLLERYKYILPNNRRDLKFFNHDISERNAWICVRDLPGEHYVTCTTVKDSRMCANVVCKVENDTKNLVPMTATCDEAQIERWLKNFFAKVRFQRSINGHISFRFVKCQGQFLPLGVRLGVSLPYICYNRSHAQILCRTIKCVHQMSQLKSLNSSSSSEEENSTTLTAFGSNWRWSSIEKTGARVALDKREALFAYWDPLPYCAYYHFQLPLESVKTFLQKRHRSAKSLSPRITTMPVH